MNWLAETGLVGLTAGLLWYFVDQQPADVYNMPVEQAYGLLTRVDFRERTEGQEEAGVTQTSVGNGSNKVTWRMRGSHVSRECDIALAPFEGDTARTHVTVTCEGGGAGDGAAAGMTHNMHRNRVIERLDATLTGRAFDPSRVGETSDRWPSDGVDGSLGGAMNEAIKMDQEMRQMQAEMDEQAEYDSGFSQENLEGTGFVEDSY